MLRPLFRLAAHQPQLLADHLEAYGELAASDMARVAAQWKLRAASRLLGYGALALAALLAAMALMLLAVIPVAAMNQPWLLAAVPAVPAVVGLSALFFAPRVTRGQAFAALRSQWAADAAMLRASEAAVT